MSAALLFALWLGGGVALYAVLSWVAWRVRPREAAPELPAELGSVEPWTDIRPVGQRDDTQTCYLDRDTREIMTVWQYRERERKEREAQP